MEALSRYVPVGLQAVARDARVALAFQIVGALWVSIVLARTLTALVLASLLRAITRRPVRSYGEWAVVTGATDGIGKAYAFELARRGMKVLLISRTPARLADVAAELRTAVPTVPGVDTLAHDFSVTPTDASVARLVAACAERDVGVLVNNVGASYPSALYFHEVEGVEPGLTRSMVATNVNSVIEMTKAVLPGMLARKRGAIVNISSANGRVPTGSPLYALYAGTKAFVEAFSRSLAGEYARRGLTVTCQSPYFVVSKLSKIRAASLGVPTPAAYAAAAVAAIGDGPSTVPYLAHAAQDAVVQGAPHFLLSRLTLSMHESIRARFMAKRARESKTA